MIAMNENEASASKVYHTQGKRFMTALSVMMVHDPRLRWVSDVKYLGREHNSEHQSFE